MLKGDTDETDSLIQKNAMCVNNYISASRGSIYARIKPAQCRAARKPRPDDQMAKQKKLTTADSPKLPTQQITKRACSKSGTYHWKNDVHRRSVCVWVNFWHWYLQRAAW